MWFFTMFGYGFAATLGCLFAVGLCTAFDKVFRGKKK